MSLNNDEIYVTGLPTNLTKEDIATFFGSIGAIKKNKRGRPEIYIPTFGKAYVTYDDVAVAQSSISWFDGKDFNGHTIKVQSSEIEKHHSGKMSFSKNFTLDPGNGLRNCYFGKIELSSFEIDGNVDFTISIYHVEKMHVHMKIPSSRLTPNVVSKNGKVEDDDGEVCCKMKTTLEMEPWVIRSLSMHTIHNSFEATITVTFEPLAPKKEEYYAYYDILQLSKLSLIHI